MHLFLVFHLQRRPVPLHSSTFFKNLIFIFSVEESCRFYLFICFIARCFCVFRISAGLVNDMLVPEALPSELPGHAGAPASSSGMCQNLLLISLAKEF